MKFTRKATIEEIRVAADQLRKAGFVVSVISISEHLQASRASIWKQLKQTNEKALLDYEKALLDYEKHKRGSGAKTIIRIREAVGELKKKGVKTTTNSVASYLGISVQRVREVLLQAGELSILDSFRRREEIERIAGAVKTFQTEGLYLSDIKKLPIEGIAGLSDDQMSKMLARYKIPHALNRLDKINTIKNTELYTAQELYKMVGGDSSYVSFRDVLYKNKIPFKNGRRNRGTIEAVIETLKSMDTSKHTMRELYELTGSGSSLAAFRTLLHRDKIPYKKDKKGPRKC